MVPLRHFLNKQSLYCYPGGPSWSWQPKNATCMSIINPYSSKWYPRLLWGTFRSHCYPSAYTISIEIVESIGRFLIHGPCSMNENLLLEQGLYCAALWIRIYWFTDLFLECVSASSLTMMLIKICFFLWLQICWSVTYINVCMLATVVAVCMPCNFQPARPVCYTHTYHGMSRSAQVSAEYYLHVHLHLLCVPQGGKISKKRQNQ